MDTTKYSIKLVAELFCKLARAYMCDLVDCRLLDVYIVVDKWLKEQG